MGEKLCAPQTKHGLGNSTTPSYRKEANTMPSPFGEGQTDTPINRHNRGEVPGRLDLFITPFISN